MLGLRPFFVDVDVKAPLCQNKRRCRAGRSSTNDDNLLVSAAWGELSTSSTRFIRSEWNTSQFKPAGPAPVMTIFLSLQHGVEYKPIQATWKGRYGREGTTSGRGVTSALFDTVKLPKAPVQV